ncbi:hypothetical protein DPMN_009304 [Dreissena polymorpha]|uniref:Uncharacterized protein n=1 Tax=Dreissena polymorpha TaxID=45954 RepID=A0A9D4N014_DREPO|nr:hypothetical protein DPMN_009304 [Dreissena polymorpha]
MDVRVDGLFLSVGVLVTFNQNTSQKTYQPGNKSKLSDLDLSQHSAHAQWDVNKCSSCLKQPAFDRFQRLRLKALF